MNKGTQKLYNILKIFYNDMIDDIKRDIVGAMQDKEQIKMSSSMFAGMVGTWLTLEPKQEENYKMILSEFEILSTFMEANEFSAKDKLSVISTIVEKNIKNSLLDDTVTINADEEKITEDLIGAMFNIENILEYRKDATYFESFIRLQKTRIDHTKQDPTIKRGILDKLLHNYRSLQNSHIAFKAHYLDKKQTYTKEDIMAVSSALIEMGITSDTAKQICEYLESKLAKRKIIEIKPVIESKQVVIEQPKPINQRQIKKTFKELETYFDFFNMTPIRTLTYEEIIFCLAKIKQTDCTVGLMNEFITKQDRYNLQNDPILNAEVILNRLKAYQESFEEHNSDYIDVTGAITSLEGYLNEIHNTEDDSEKDIWMGFVNEEIPYALSLMPKTK